MGPPQYLPPRHIPAATYHAQYASHRSFCTEPPSQAWASAPKSSSQVDSLSCVRLNSAASFFDAVDLCSMLCAAPILLEGSWDSREARAHLLSLVLPVLCLPIHPRTSLPSPSLTHPSYTLKLSYLTALFTVQSLSLRHQVGLT